MRRVIAEGAALLIAAYTREWLSWLADARAARRRRRRGRWGISTPIRTHVRVMPW